LAISRISLSVGKNDMEKLIITMEIFLASIGLKIGRKMQLLIFIRLVKPMATGDVLI